MAILHGVAPAELIRQDFAVLDARETLRTTWAIEQVVLLQSVLGHAHEGHGVFRGRRYPNTAMDDIVRALRLDPVTIRRERQAIIDHISEYADAVMRGEEPPALLDRSHGPLLGMSTLRHIRVKPADVLRGLYVGGLRDESEVRAEVERERGIRIGGGKAYYVDYHRLAESGIDAEQLAHGEWAGEIDRFRREGIITSPEREGEPGVVYQYIRHRRGPGASDDAAIVGAGFLWGLGVAVGVFFADAIDTLEKYVPEYRDQDSALARRIEQGYSSLGFGMAEVKQLTYVAAGSDEGEGVPDSSLRHLLAIDRQTDLCAAEAHLLAVEGVPTPPIGLSHERMPSNRFYAYLRERVEKDRG